MTGHESDIAARVLPRLRRHARSPVVSADLRERALARIETRRRQAGCQPFLGRISATRRRRSCCAALGNFWPGFASYHPIAADFARRGLGAQPVAFGSHRKRRSFRWATLSAIRRIVWASWSSAQGHFERTAWLLTGSWEEPEDLVASSLTKVWHRWNRASATDNAYAYARRMLVNSFLSSRRRRWKAEYTHASPNPLLWMTSRISWLCG